mmetsp:Transcript_62471/g.177425  ORF Transcript_62471/g.177425 Transcript_62471/m.177425 type:complete len:227 (-) Transcript_62471:139-819(-)
MHQCHEKTANPWLQGSGRGAGQKPLQRPGVGLLHVGNPGLLEDYVKAPVSWKPEVEAVCDFEVEAAPGLGLALEHELPRDVGAQHGARAPRPRQALGHPAPARAELQDARALREPGQQRAQELAVCLVPVLLLRQPPPGIVPDFPPPLRVSRAPRQRLCGRVCKRDPGGARKQLSRHFTPLRPALMASFGRNVDIAATMRACAGSRGTQQQLRLLQPMRSQLRGEH